MKRKDHSLTYTLVVILTYVIICSFFYFTIHAAYFIFIGDCLYCLTVFGLIETDSISKIGFLAVEAAPAISSSFGENSKESG